MKGSIRMATYEIPDNFEELREWVLSKEEELSNDQNQGNDFNKEIESINNMMNELTAKRRAMEVKRNELRNKVRTDKTVLEQAKRRLDTFASDRAIHERIEELSREFDSLTETAYWREWAFEHQIEGAKRLAASKRGILGDKRGLGKTLTSIIWADMVGAKKIIVFAPKDVLSNFKRELERWAPHRNVAILGGMPKGQRDMFLDMLSKGITEQCLLLCNYEAWRRDPELLQHIKRVKFDTVVIDEAHNIKQRTTSAYKGIREIIYGENCCNLCGSDIENFRNEWGNERKRCCMCLHEPEEFGDFCSVKNVLPMTGTPILNKPQDLWTMLHLVDREIFPDERSFLEDYCTQDLYTGRWMFQYGGEEALIKKLGPRFVSRDRKSAGVKIPPQTIQRHYVEFDKQMYADQWRVMQQIQEYGAIKFTEDVALSVVGILAELTRRRQAITWPHGIKIFDTDENGYKIPGKVLYEAPVTESIKIDKCMEIAHEIIEEEDRLVIFSQFKEALKEIEQRFNSEDISVIRYDGDLSDDKAQVAQMDFDGKTAPTHPKGTECDLDCPNFVKPHCEGYKFQVILCQYKKGGVGLNLNAARQMIILDREWNPGKEDQAQGRIDRIDNKHETVVHTIHVPDTIDSFMDDLIEQKENIIQGFETEHEQINSLLDALRNKDLM